MITGSLFGTSRAVRNSGALMKDLRTTLNDLQRQMATGEKAESYGGLGVARRISLNTHARLAKLNGYFSVIENANTRIALMDGTLTGLGKIVTSARSAALAEAYEPSANGRTIAQVSADDQIKMAIDMLNVDQGGRYLFSGRTADIRPVATFDEIMNGSAGRAGLRQLIQERTTADLGTGGLGRLVAPALAGSTVTLERDAGNPGPFGFTISGGSTSSPNIAVAGPTGPTQALSVNFAGQPTVGQTVTVTLTLPDGSQQNLTLTASASPGTPTPPNRFVIGASAAATAANFQASLQNAVQVAAQTSLTSGSAIAAAQAFFSGSINSPPMRVPAPAAGATALAAGTAADTVIWYRGDDDTTAFPNARTTAVANVGDALAAGVGARANEEGIAQVLAMLGAMSAVDVSPADPNGAMRYQELRSRVAQGLGFPNAMQSVSAIQVELAAASSALASAKERHTAMKSLLTDSLQQVERADTQEVAALILSLQTRLEATYATTATLSQLSLVQYLS